MNALILKTCPDGVDLTIQTDPSDVKAKLLTEHLYQLILQWEKDHPEVEAKK